MIGRIGQIGLIALLGTVLTIEGLMGLVGCIGFETSGGTQGYQGAPVHADGTPIAPPAWQTNGPTVGKSDGGTVERSGKWPAVRAHHLVKEPCCAWCGGTVKLQVHHIRPFHLYPQLELDDSNLITLCEDPKHNCHLLIGHLGNFRTGWNADARADCSLHATYPLYRPPEMQGRVRPENEGHVGTVLRSDGLTVLPSNRPTELESP